MLLPALSKARAKARSISCVNILKNLMLCEVMYSTDNDGYLVSCMLYTQEPTLLLQQCWYNDTGLKPYGPELFTRKSPISSTTAVPMCPSCIGENGQVFRFPASPTNFSRVSWGGYTHTRASGYTSKSISTTTRYLDVQLKSPSNKMCIWDGEYHEGGSTRNIWSSTYIESSVRWERHNGSSLRANIGFYDGHVGVLKYIASPTAYASGTTTMQDYYYYLDR